MASRSRGDVTIWLSEDAIAAWVPPKNGLRGGQRLYSNLAVRDRVDAAGRLQPAAPSDRGVPGTRCSA